MNYTGGEHGIMAAILSMASPPSFGASDSNSKSNKQDKTGGGPKKNNRAQAKESYCEGCGDTGESLLICITCSVCYHSVCDDPPIKYDSLKEVEWQCRSCRNKKTNEGNYTCGSLDEAIETSSDDDIELPSEKDVHRTISDISDESDKETKAVEVQGEHEARVDEEMQNKISENREGKKKVKILKQIKKVFKQIVVNGKTVNPNTFDLPRSYHQNNQYQFPGTSRSLIRKPGVVKLKPTIIDLENCTVPKPLTLCHHCGRSCRTAPLLKCDYCPKYFHFDCLNPPLTLPPIGLWICPLHPEPFLESKKLTSTQLSQRVRIWDMTHKQIDRNSVVLNFLKKCSRKNPAFGRKIPILASQLYEVPEGDGNFVQHMETDPSSSNYFFPEEIKTDTVDAQNINGPPRCDVGFKGDKKNNTGEKQTDTSCPAPVKNGIDFLLEAASKMSSDIERRTQYLKVLSVDQVYELAGQRLEDIDILYNNNIKSIKSVSNDFKSGSELSNEKTIKIAKYTIQLYCLNLAKVLKFSSSSILIGTDSNDDPTCAVFNPETFVNCKRLSGCHAVIFYDRCHKQWEILNYSPHGIIVDSVQYIINATYEKEEDPVNDLEAMKSQILQRRKIIVEKMLNPRFFSRPGFFPIEGFVCPCEDAESSSIMKIRNEGSAILCKGSEIQVGCLKLVVKSIDTEEEEVTAGFTTS